jgi:hypothetical protein
VKYDKMSDRMEKIDKTLERLADAFIKIAEKKISGYFFPFAFSIGVSLSSFFELASGAFSHSSRLLTHAA